MPKFEERPLETLYLAVTKNVCSFIASYKQGSKKNKTVVVIENKNNRNCLKHPCN